jgi:OmpA-OmpF porin, OOP family
MNTVHRIALTAVAILITLPAQAQLYAGATAGESRTKLNGENLTSQFLDFGYSDAQTQSSQRASAYRVFGGYQLNGYVGVEAGYADFGTSRIRTSVVPQGAFERRIDTTGFDLSLVGTLPVTNKFRLFARAGAFMNERRTNFSTAGNIELLNGVQGMKERKTSATYGAGVIFDLTPKIALRAELAQTEKYSDILLSQTSRIDMYSIGLQYRF